MVGAPAFRRTRARRAGLGGRVGVAGGHQSRPALGGAVVGAAHRRESELGHVDDAAHARLVDDGQAQEALVVHELERLEQRRVGRQRLGVGRHDVAHQRVVGEHALRRDAREQVLGRQDALDHDGLLHAPRRRRRARVSDDDDGAPRRGDRSSCFADRRRPRDDAVRRARRVEQVADRRRRVRREGLEQRRDCRRDGRVVLRRTLSTLS
mmetsp:Transcript_3237/g.12394  ORF Transcript_3237/g.12394 Transcript_3237/m.12394 type:complete len:209 (+) Transcript_3237:669-1295(+)